jgi:glyoxylase-like metal-dependent hydrolase (beta-lactamase superfamily II)
MTGGPGTGHVTGSVAAVAERLPAWATRLLAPNPGPMTLEGTNTWVLRGSGTGESLVVDPGPDDEAHLRAVAEAAGPVAAVLVTHGHPDHVDGLARFRELTGARVAELPTAHQPVHVAGLVVTAFQTPGHTADSVCYLVDPDTAAADPERAILTGDTILGRGTTVVAWPDGDLGDYLASLEWLTGFPGVRVLPGHGPPLADCAAAASYYLAHRRARLAQVRAAMAAGATTPAEIVGVVYPDIDRALRPAAEWSTQAQLAYLDRERRESHPGATPLDTP